MRVLHLCFVASLLLLCGDETVVAQAANEPRPDVRSSVEPSLPKPATNGSPASDRIGELELRLVERMSTIDKRISQDVAELKGDGAWAKFWVGNVLTILLSIVGLFVTVLGGSIFWFWKRVDEYQKKIEGAEVYRNWDEVQKSLGKLKYQQRLDDLKFDLCFLIARKNLAGRDNGLVEELNLALKLCSGSERGVREACNLLEASEKIDTGILETLPIVQEIYRNYDKGLSERIGRVLKSFG